MPLRGADEGCHGHLQGDAQVPDGQSSWDNQPIHAHERSLRNWIRVWSSRNLRCCFACYVSRQCNSMTCSATTRWDNASRLPKSCCCCCRSSSCCCCGCGEGWWYIEKKKKRSGERPSMTFFRAHRACLPVINLKHIACPGRHGKWRIYNPIKRKVQL